MKTGDEVLVVGPAFFEKTKIKELKKGILYLENGIQTDRQLNPLNSKYKVERFDNEKYEILVANRILARGIEKLDKIYHDGIGDPKKIKYAAHKLQKILDKLS